MADAEKVRELIERVDRMKKSEKLDLSSDQDLSIALMNLISIEEHFFFTGAKLGKPEYYDLIREVREMRKVLLKRIVKDAEGEVWCISKHLLAASMRLMEVGTKQLGAGRREEAEDLFGKAYDLYALFWGVNMGAVSTEGLQRVDEEKLHAKDPKRGLVAKLGDLVRRAIDCCIE